LNGRCSQRRGVPGVVFVSWKFHGTSENASAEGISQQIFVSLTLLNVAFPGLLWLFLALL
jgi:hypothetical protein